MSLIRKPVLHLSAAMLALAMLVPSGAASAQTPPPGEALSTYTIGDRLKISFFEELDLPGSQQTANAAVRTLYHRVDLTAEYSVAADGTVDLPRLGRLVLAGRTSEEVREELLARYEEQMGRAGDAHIAIIERQPVYVVGPVRQPGAFRFTEGMVAIQAIALAGGTEGGRERLDPLVRARQETERSDQGAAKLAGLLARQAYLEAEQDGRAPVAPADLVDLIGRTEAERLIAAEMRAGATASSARQSEIRAYEATIHAALREVASIEESAERIAREIDARLAMVGHATQPDPRLTDRQTVGRLRSEIAALELQRQQLQGEIQRINQAIARDAAARDRIRLDHGAAMARDIITVAGEIVATKQSVVSAEGLAGSIYGALGPAGSETSAIEIVRSTREGPVTFAGTETTALKPGDVLRVRQLESGTGLPRTGSILR